MIMTQTRRVLIVGGGAAGMMAAISAARCGCQVDLYEKNEKLGKKLFITGKGRCNVTNACEGVEAFLPHVVSNPRFLYSAFYGFDNQAMMAFLESEGLHLKVERGLRVFPVSDKSSDVIRTLEQAMRKAGVRVHLNAPVKSLIMEEDRVCGLTLASGEAVAGDAVILAAGGLSYPSTGSDGDGYRLAKSAGHSVTSLTPSLVPMVVEEDWCRDLQGLSLRNIGFVLKRGRKKIYEGFGEMMFTHFGITGPVVLTGSTRIAPHLKKGPVSCVIDLKPALSESELDARLLRDFDKYHQRQMRNALGDLLPSSLIPVVLLLAQIDPYLPVHELDRQSRLRLLSVLKGLTMTVTALRGYNEAVITQGGVNVREIRPDTMASRKKTGLYMAGEMLDVDAETGGFNLQIAWSTAWAAGLGAARGI